MRRLTAILLLCALSFQGIGHFVLYKVQRHHFRSQVKDFLRNHPDTDLITTILIQPGQASRLQWEHSKEFRFQGRMYDVLQSQQHPNGDIAYLCLPDDDETAWLASHESLLRAGNGKRQAAAMHEVDLLKLLFCSYFSPEAEPLPLIPFALAHPASPCSIPNTPTLSLVSPPPRC